MLEFDPERVRANVRQASDEDLIDRITAYRAGMEAEAIAIIEGELRSRGVAAEEIAARAEWCERETIRLADGMSAKCSFCRRPAVSEGWGWHRMFKLIPVFPRRLYRCVKHAPLSPLKKGGRRC